MPRVVCARGSPHIRDPLVPRMVSSTVPMWLGQPGMLVSVIDGDLDDALRRDELVSAGGSWNGLLFDNPRLGLAPTLTWTFTFRFHDVGRGDSSSEVSVAVDWVPLPGARWPEITPRQVASSRFAEPVEASVYFFEHYRFDSVELQLLQQQGAQLRASATLNGDIDGLGLDEVHVEDWLHFDGIIVSLNGLTSAQAARSQLGSFTDVSGLSQGGRTAGGGFLFSS